MNLATIIAIIVTLAILVLSVQKLRKFKFNLRVIVRIGVVAAITVVLDMIKIVPFPQGGGCSLLSVLPLMILAVLFSSEETLICTIVVSFIEIILQPPYYPMQIPLDYFGSMMSIAFITMFGIDKKSKLIFGAVVASLLSVSFNVLSGIIFFGQFAPKGMNVWVYSIIYNFSGYGVELLLSIIVLSILPLKNLKRAIIKNGVSV
ncbi:energy-coupled thiamine transporter ThiT [Clostridium sp. Marseille-Q2269]|uniref:energy-coupled thiamine transporter ThiT n=1 Tax=Clostridium sp. Marseille-Q2269 TaxID=2942205 RepID=UPI00207440F5|nr:energy-coupled thiamine transporter ThiT [Clostridium sp. Marseille-Q2269]